MGSQSEVYWHYKELFHLFETQKVSTIVTRNFRRKCLILPTNALSTCMFGNLNSFGKTLEKVRLNWSLCVEFFQSQIMSTYGGGGGNGYGRGYLSGGGRAGRDPEDYKRKSRTGSSSSFDRRQRGNLFQVHFIDICIEYSVSIFSTVGMRHV